MAISVTSSGSFKNMEKFLQAMQKLKIADIARQQAERGVAALRSATPLSSGLAANSWSYKIVESRSSVRVIWINTDVENGFQVAIALQYGYSTGTGGYVAGRDYINPAIRPVFDSIANDVWKAVTSA